MYRNFISQFVLLCQLKDVKNVLIKTKSCIEQHTRQSFRQNEPCDVNRSIYFSGVFFPTSPLISPFYDVTRLILSDTLSSLIEQECDLLTIPPFNCLFHHK